MSRTVVVFCICVGVVLFACGEDRGAEATDTASADDTGAASDTVAAGDTAQVEDTVELDVTGDTATGDSSTGDATAGDVGDAGDTGLDTTDMPPTPGDDPTYPCDITGATHVIDATPADYRSKLAALQPGDRLVLAAGTYDQGLPVHDLHGTAEACIVIEGPDELSAVLTGSDSRNTVSIKDASHVVVRSLELDGLGLAGDGVKAEGSSTSAHHIAIENLRIVNHGGGQQTVGISTKCPAWDWVIRGNTIVGAGTGLYLGNSNGEDEFVGGVIEHNRVLDTLGYNLQLKHQNGRTLDEVPGAATTVIRHNTFSKANDAAGGANARPNVLVGHQPTSGRGQEADVVLYGNFFYENPTDALLQAEGNLTVYSNVFVNLAGSGIHIRPHNAVPRHVYVFQNTIVADATGVRLTGADANATQVVVGNLAYGNTPYAVDSGEGANRGNQTSDSQTELMMPLATPGNGLDVSPQPGQIQGTWDRNGIPASPDMELDYEGRPHDASTFGAYIAPATQALEL